MTDQELLIAFQRSAGDAARALFSELIHRHVDFVYSVARRQMKEAHLAEDVTQEVFIALLHKASRMAAGVPLTGWLFTTTRRKCLQAHRAAGRRIRYERDAGMMKELSTSLDPTWSLIVDDLDHAISRLAPHERDAVLLRYFSGKSHEEIASALAISEEAAKKRIHRGLESLRGILTGRGLAVPAAGLAAALAAHATAEAAPAGVTAAVTQASLHAMTAMTGSTITLKGLLMAMNVKTTVIAAAVALAVGIPVAMVVMRPGEAGAKASVGKAPELAEGAPAVSPGVREAQAREDAAALAEFRAAYALKEGELLRHVEEPFVTARFPIGWTVAQNHAHSTEQAFAVLHAGQFDVPANPAVGATPPARADGGGANPPVMMAAQRSMEPPPPPASMVLIQSADGWLGYTGGIWASPKTPDAALTVRSALKYALGNAYQDQALFGPAEILNRKIGGDFVFREGVSATAMVPPLEKMLSKALGKTITLELADVTREAYVVSGTWKFKPAAGEEKAILHFYATDWLEEAPAGVEATDHGMYAIIKEWVNMPVFNEAQGWPGGLHLMTHGPAGGRLADEGEQAKMLAHFIEQSGLSCTRETRLVHMLTLNVK
jgi:RNA polymerase sigma factor (sigma-70 family)